MSYKHLFAVILLLSACQRDILPQSVNLDPGTTPFVCDVAPSAIQHTVPPSSTIDTFPLPSIATSSWHECTDPNGIRFRYPDTWIATITDELVDGFSIYLSDSAPAHAGTSVPHIRMSVFDDRGAIDIEQWCFNANETFGGIPCPHEESSTDTVVFGKTQYGYSGALFTKQRAHDPGQEFYIHIAPYVVRLSEEHAHGDVILGITHSLHLPSTDSDDLPVGLNKYRNDALGFELYYPDTTDWTVQDPEMIEEVTSITLREYPHVTVTFSPSGTVDDEIAYWKKMSIVQTRKYESAIPGSQRIVLMPDDAQVSVVYLFPHPSGTGYYTLGVFNVDPIAAELLDPVAESFRIAE